MNYKNKVSFILILFCFFAFNINSYPQSEEKPGEISELRNSVIPASERYLSIREATDAIGNPEVVAPLAIHEGPLPEPFPPFCPPFTPLEPIKLFDDFYFVGTTAVGAYIADSHDGLIMFDTGCGDEDAAIMVESMKKIGLDPSDIKLIFISHEHFDHYGGASYFKKNVCPDVKIAMSLTAWNFLQTVPMEWAYIGKRPDSVDIFLKDGMKIKLGETFIQAVATPGHSPGCTSFIISVTDIGEKHTAGIMGGSAVFPPETEAYLYKTSIEYFKAIAIENNCDIGLYYHMNKKTYMKIQNHLAGEPNPLILGVEGFDRIYLQSFRNRYEKFMNSDKINSN